MHPLVLESLTEQRLEDLRSSTSSRPSHRGPRNSRSRGRSGPVGRTQARMGFWMVETGMRMVNNGGATPGAGSFPGSTASASL